jgi:Matrixin
MNRTLALTLCVATAACGGSKSSPTSPETPRVLQGQTVSAVDGSATGQVSISVGNRFAIQSDGDGNFQVDVGGPGTFATVLTGGRIVERHTSITGPTAERTKVSLIPAGFDLPAFDEMFRGSNSRLQRWTSRPSLVVLGSVMKYASGNLERFEATGERLTDDEVTALTNHLNEGLGLLTGGAYTSFASVDVEWPGAGEQVNVRRTGTIVVGRYSGIRNLAQTIGYGSWAEQPDGTVVGGAMWLDRDFDRDDAQRRLLRIHELGHALGYNHVTVRTSIMNPSLGPSPTDFDRAAASIAFQRPVGNVSPDTDPGSTARTFAVADGPARWSNPIR